MSPTTLSQAHQLLLAQFRTAREVPATGYLAGHPLEQWTEVLQQPLSSAIKSLATQGLIEVPTDEEIIESALKVPEIKDRLRKLGLPLSGKKMQLAERLALADPALAKSLAKDHLLFKGTLQGARQIAEFLEASEAARSAIEESVIQFLADDSYRRAARTLAEFEAAQVFPRGMGIDWAHYDTAHDEQVLQLIFSQIPQSLAAVPHEHLPTFRLAAGMLHLMWNVGQTSTWLSQRFPSQDQDSLFKIASDLHSFALFLTEIDSLKQTGYSRFRVLTCNDELVCPSCRELASKAHSVNTAIEIPNPRCTSQWCRCWIAGSWSECT